MILALISSAALASEAEAGMSMELHDFTRDATAWVLEGEHLPHDYRQQLMQMTPADRIMAIAFLRRAGLLHEDAWSLDELLELPDPERSHQP